MPTPQTTGHRPMRRLGTVLLVAGAMCVTTAVAHAAQPVARIAAAATSGYAEATTSHDGTALASAVDQTDDPVDEAAAFTDCMRSHGVPDFPGITISADKRVHLDVSGTGVNPTSAQYRDANTACAHLLPEGVSLPKPPQPPSPPFLEYELDRLPPPLVSPPDPPGQPT